MKTNGQRLREASADSFHGEIQSIINETARTVAHSFALMVARETRPQYKAYNHRVTTSGNYSGHRMTERQVSALVNDIREGMSYNGAAKKHGVSYTAARYQAKLHGL